jgi:hypothetical protein
MEAETNINFSETLSDTHILLTNNVSVMKKAVLFHLSLTLHLYFIFYCVLSPNFRTLFLNFD